MSSLPARVYRKDLPAQGLPGVVSIDGSGISFKGEGLGHRLDVDLLEARLGGLNDATLFLSDRRSAGTEIALDRERVEATAELVALRPVTAALNRARSRQRRFWACAAALAAVLLIFVVMMVALGGLILRALVG